MPPAVLRSGNFKGKQQRHLFDKHYRITIMLFRRSMLRLKTYEENSKLNRKINES